MKTCVLVISFHIQKVKVICQKFTGKKGHAFWAFLAKIIIAAILVIEGYPGAYTKGMTIISIKV